MRMLLFIALGVLPLVLPVGVVQAQPVHEEVSEVVEARVVRVTTEEVRLIPGTETPHTYQTIEAELLSGPRASSQVTVVNDFLKLSPGDRFFAIRYEEVGGEVTYSVQDVDRRGPLTLLILFFVGTIVVFGGWYGLRALGALALSLFVLAFVLVPGLLAGWNPLVACFSVSALVLGGAIFLTHGMNRESCIAYAGTLLAVFGTLLLARFAVSWGSLSGFSAEESVYLNFNSRGTLDLVGLLIGSIVIGTLGVLDDIAITQVAVVRELRASAPDLSRAELFVRAMRVGREHVGAVVNTLALAYVGASLPLVLLMHTSPISGTALFNMELFATELVRTIVGSFGIVLTVPIVTYLAVRFVRPGLVQGDARVVQSHHHH